MDQEKNSNIKPLEECNTCIMQGSRAMCCEGTALAVALYELKKEIPIIRKYVKPPICQYYCKEEEKKHEMSKEVIYKTCMDCEPRDNCKFILNKYGYCCYCMKPNCDALIFNLYIHKEFRRLGHAREIIKTCITAIRESGYEKEIKIEAEPRENSISVEDLVFFYRKMGLAVL